MAVLHLSENAFRGSEREPYVTKKFISVIYEFFAIS
jgi:hypothetical protein